MIHITVCACLRLFFVNLYSSGVFCFYFNVTVHFKIFYLDINHVKFKCNEMCHINKTDIKLTLPYCCVLKPLLKGHMLNYYVIHVCKNNIILQRSHTKLLFRLH